MEVLQEPGHQSIKVDRCQYCHISEETFRMLIYNFGPQECLGTLQFRTCGVRGYNGRRRGSRMHASERSIVTAPKVNQTQNSGVLRCCYCA